MVVPQAALLPAMTTGKPGLPAAAALLPHEVPRVAKSLTTIEFGRMPVRVVLIRSSTTDSAARPLGVTRQEQHDTICSSGENAYTFTQIEPTS